MNGTPESEASAWHSDRKKRLERCRKALTDPAQSKRSVSEIAYSWGFCDLTHFGRAFRAAYGMLPSECRQLALKPS
jgi:AraC-like DNA-binding protein